MKDGPLQFSSEKVRALANSDCDLDQGGGLAALKQGTITGLALALATVSFQWVHRNKIEVPETLILGATGALFGTIAELSARGAAVEGIKRGYQEGYATALEREHLITDAPSR